MSYHTACLRRMGGFAHRRLLHREVRPDSMTAFLKDCCVLNIGSGAWAFEPLANQLSASLGVEVSDEPRAFNYLLHVDQRDWPSEEAVCIPIESVRLAADKRLLAARFAEFDVPTPVTRLLDPWDAVLDYVRRHSTYEWCLKYPTSCGGSGHRLISGESAEPPNWPRPFIVQEFVRLERPEVFRMYCAAGELFG